jgi:hypothetical protein
MTVVAMDAAGQNSKVDTTNLLSDKVQEKPEY